MKVNKVHLTPTESTVLRIINQDSVYAEDDQLLITRIWHSEGWNDKDALYVNLKRVTSASTIKRARRHLHQMGLIQYPEKVLRSRHQAFVDHRDKYSTHSFLKRLVKRVL